LLIMSKLLYHIQSKGLAEAKFEDASGAAHSKAHASEAGKSSVPGVKSADMSDTGGGSIYMDGLTPQQIEDWQLSSVWAQRRAAHDFPPSTENLEGWYKVYNNELLLLGWGSDSLNFTKYVFTEETVKLEAAIIDVLKAILLPSEVDIITSVIKTLAKNPEQMALSYLNEAAGQTETKFQVATLGSNSGVLTAKLGLFKYTMNTKTTKVSFMCSSLTKTNTSVYLYKDARVVGLANTVFSDEVRKVLRSRLNPKDHLANAEI